MVSVQGIHPCMHHKYQHNVGMPVQLDVDLVPALLQQLLLRLGEEGQCLCGRCRQMLQCLLAPAMGYPETQFREQRGQLAAIPVETVLHLLGNRAVQVLGHMTTEHARMGVNGYVDLLRPQAGREYGNGQDGGGSLEVNCSKRLPLVNTSAGCEHFNIYTHSQRPSGRPGTPA